MSRRSHRAGRSGLTVGAIVGLLIAVVGALAGSSAGGCRGAGNSSPSTSGGKSSPTSRANAAPNVHLELGAPADNNPLDDDLLLKPQYALSYNRAKNVANWVSWNLNASHFGDALRHKGKFIADTSLPEGVYRVRHDDYVGSGYDRGHMVRSEERTRTDDDNKATFLLTNILPQTHDLNGGPWLRLEEYCQTLAQKDGRELFLVAGGVFGKRRETIGKDVAVPELFFKIVVVLDKGQGASDVRESTRVIAVLMPNTTGIIDNDWSQYRTTVDELEKRTGYDFLVRVPEAIQAVIEARQDSGPTK